MTQEEFNEFCDETIPQHLFHVGYNDVDKRGIRIEEFIIVNLIHNNIECLKYKPLQWFIDTYLKH